MCAAVAAQSDKKILLVDHAEKAGKKILISGGGRCNFTNLNILPERFLSNNPHFAKSALKQFTQHDFIDLVNSYQIAWHEKTLGQLFCDGSAKQIVDMLLNECAENNVEVKLSTEVKDITKSDDGFTVKTSNGIFQAPSMVNATGGPSIPKMGATDFAYKLARQLGLKIVEPRPALVPLTLSNEQSLFKELSGVAANVFTKRGKTQFEEAALFTHKGLSGPAILQISSYWKHGEKIHIDFLPSLPKDFLLNKKHLQPKASLQSALASELPDRLAKVLSEKLSAEHSIVGPISEIKNQSLAAIQSKLNAWEFNPNGTEGFAKAEVTIGGISTDELSSKTMESKKIKGLYVIGEAVDVTGWLGGYNFQWAWSSGYAAGKSLRGI